MGSPWLLIGKPNTKECLEKAIEGETYEFTTMYPEFLASAVSEQEKSEFNEQIAESKEHAEQFKIVLTKAEKRFAALAKVEKRHATAYQTMLQEVQ
jgi:rubrerythrin